MTVVVVGVFFVFFGAPARDFEEKKSMGTCGDGTVPGEGRRWETADAQQSDLEARRVYVPASLVYMVIKYCVLKYIYRADGGWGGYVYVPPTYTVLMGMVCTYYVHAMYTTYSNMRGRG